MDHVACFCICFCSLASSLLFHRLTQRHLSSQQLCWVMTLVSHYRIIKLPLERWYQRDVFCFPILNMTHTRSVSMAVYTSALWCFFCLLAPSESSTSLSIKRDQQDEFTNVNQNCTDMLTGRKSCSMSNAECSLNSSCCVCRCVYSHSTFRSPGGCVENAVIRAESGKYI